MELKGLSAEKWTWTGIVCAYDFFVSDIYIYTLAAINWSFSLRKT